MRVGISTHPVHDLQGHPQKGDGIGTYTTNLMAGLDPQKAEVKKVYFRRPKEFGFASQGADFLIAQNPFLSLYSPYPLYRALEKEIDILHVTDYAVPKLQHTPVVATLHDAIPVKHPEWWGGSLALRRFKNHILKKSVAHADHVITISHAVVEDIETYWEIPKERISVVPCGIIPLWFQRIPDSEKKMILKKYDLQKPFFLFVGTLHPRKNLGRILEAYFSLPKELQTAYDLVIVGKNHPGLTPPELGQKIAAYHAEGKIKWLSYLPFLDLQGLYQAAQALLFPSLAEGFGMPILEGFASQTPVITSRIGSTAEVAAEAAYLIDPEDTEELQFAMEKLARDPSLRTSYIQQGQERVQEYTWEACCQKIYQVYQKILGSNIRR